MRYRRTLWITSITIGSATSAHSSALSMASDLRHAPAAENQTGMVFKPMKEGKEQLAQVASAHLTSSSTEDSLARLNFAAESEVGINEQIK